MQVVGLVKAPCNVTRIESCHVGWLFCLNASFSATTPKGKSNVGDAREIQEYLLHFPKSKQKCWIPHVAEVAIPAESRFAGTNFRVVIVEWKLPCTIHQPTWIRKSPRRARFRPRPARQNPCGPIFVLRENLAVGKDRYPNGTLVNGAHEGNLVDVERAANT